MRVFKGDLGGGRRYVASTHSAQRSRLEGDWGSIGVGMATVRRSIPPRDPWRPLHQRDGDRRMAEKIEKSDAEWREQLTPEQYDVLRRRGTERSFTGPYWNEKKPGVYRCAGCGEELFVSETKFDSGTGWPSFTRPAAEGRVDEHDDRSHGMVRTEVACADAAVISGTSSPTVRSRPASDTASIPPPSSSRTSPGSLSPGRSRHRAQSLRPLCSQRASEKPRDGGSSGALRPPARGLASAPVLREHPTRRSRGSSSTLIKCPSRPLAMPIDPRRAVAEA